MAVFLALLLKILPLYVFIFLGYVAGRLLKIDRETVALLLIYVLAPIVVFDGVRTVSLDFSTLSLPILFWALCSVLCLLFLALASPFWKDATRNLAAYAAGCGNSGYFGIPVALALFGDKALGLIVLGSLGFSLYESSTGFFILARGKHSVRESVMRLLRLPTLYAFFVGLVFHLFPPLSGSVEAAIVGVRGAYSTLGMMMIGLGLSGVTWSMIEARFIVFTSIAKFLLWPLAMCFILVLDTQWLHIFTPDAHRIMILLSIVPLPANSVAFSTMLRVHPAKAASAVLVTTFIALFFIPLVSMFVF